MRRATVSEMRLLARALGRYRGPRLADGIVRRKHVRPSDLDPDQLAIGVKVETEHTSRPDLALEIAMAHLAERADYYARLEQYVEPKSRRRSRKRR